MQRKESQLEASSHQKGQEGSLDGLLIYSPTKTAQQSSVYGVLFSLLQSIYNPGML